MLRSVTAKKIDWFVKDLDEGTRAVAAALTNVDLSYGDLRSILAAVNSALGEVGEVYDALKSQAGNVRGLVAASQSPTFDDALGKIVTIATRLDLLRGVIAEELGMEPEAAADPEVPGMEGDVNGGSIAEEITGEIPTAQPMPLASDQPTVEVSEDEDEDFEGDDEDADADDDEDGYGEEEDEDADEDVDFNDDDDEGGEEVEEPREATSARRHAHARRSRMRKSITAKRSAKASSGVDYMKNLWNFIGR